MDLLGGDSDEDEEIGFKINENYAKNYEKWRKKEEKQKLLDRYGDADPSGSSSSEEEIRSTPLLDKEWLRAYAVVRFQQSRLYKGEKLFHEEAKAVGKKKEKATTLKDHERKFLLEKAGIESDEDSKPKQLEGKGYFEEQEEIKQSFKEALHDTSDEDEGLLLKKEKTTEEKKNEENDYLEWLKGMKDDLDDKEAAAELAPLKAYWNDPNLSEKERVLRDYVLNNGYIDQESSSEESDGDKMAELPNFEAEEEFLEKAEEYEHKYNFRHEEPGGDELKSYPRVIDSSVRTKDTRRIDQRQRKLDKKRMIKEQRQEEIRLLQKIQMEEKKEKLERLRQIADNPELEYDLEADFDPAEHNKLMQKYFNEEYYGDDEAEPKKPKFEFDAAVDDEPGDWWQERLNEEKAVGENEDGETLEGNEVDYEPGADDPNFIMDADYDPTCDYKAEKKKNKKNKKKGEVEKLPLFDPTKTTFDEYINEYLNDKIDSLPFTYREVVPNDFGLTTEEILRAPERELNTWVSVKKMSQYKSKQDEMTERRKFQTRAKAIGNKIKVLPSLQDKEPNEDAKKKKKKKKKKKQAADAGDDTQATVVKEEGVKAAGVNKEVTQTPVLKKKDLKAKSVNKEVTQTPVLKKKDINSTSVKKEVTQTPVLKKQDINSTSVKKEVTQTPVLKKQDIKATSVKKEVTQTPVLKKQDINATSVKKEVMLADESGKESDPPGSAKKKRKRASSQTADNSECNGLQAKKRIKEEVVQPEPALHRLSPAPKEKLKNSGSGGTSSSKQVVVESELAENNTEVSSTNTPGSGISQAAPAGVSSKKNNKRKRYREKKKKKKLSIKNFNPTEASVTGEKKMVDSRQLERQLSKVMSASRLSKYGLGPNAVKMKKKKKKKQQKL